MKYLVAALARPRDHDWNTLRPWQRHSLVLAIGGGVYILIGTTYALTAPSPNRAAALAVLDFATFRGWGLAWMIVGFLALASTRWPPASKTWGYTALAGLAWCWAAAYLAGVLTGAPLSGLSATLVWSLVGFMWWAIAGLANPDDLTQFVHEEIAATNGEA